jgi:hypothetical protein
MGTVVGIIAAVLILVCLVFSGSRGLAQTPSKEPPGKAASPPAATTSEKIKSLDRAEVRALLKKLADTKPPDKRSSGAMCYSVSRPPTQASYVCPKCGERTLYDESNKSPPRDRADKGTAGVVEWGIPSCRRKIQELQKVASEAMSLDESQFCRKCSPDATSPKLVLHISYKGEKKAWDIKGIKYGDLCILHDLFTGKLLTEGEQGREFPLKDRLPRLQELLGVKLDEQ